MAHFGSSDNSIPEICCVRLKDRVKENTLFRKTIYTRESCQFVMMSIPPGGEIGMECHPHSETIFIPVKGTGRLTLNSRTRNVSQRDLFLVPGGSVHNIRNDRKGDLKLLAIYAPPAYLDGTLQETEEAAHEATRESIQHAWEQ